jgi:hypothetical protein
MLKNKATELTAFADQVCNREKFKYKERCLAVPVYTSAGFCSFVFQIHRIVLSPIGKQAGLRHLNAAIRLLGMFRFSCLKYCGSCLPHYCQGKQIGGDYNYFISCGFIRARALVPWRRFSHSCFMPLSAFVAAVPTEETSVVVSVTGSTGSSSCSPRALMVKVDGPAIGVVSVMAVVPTPVVDKPVVVTPVVMASAVALVLDTTE